MAFSIVESEEQGIAIIQLKSDDDVIMEILPNHGATLNSLKLDVDGSWVETIVGYNNYQEVPDFPGSRSSILFPFPNRLKAGKYRYEGIEYQFPTEEKHHGNAIHGLVKDLPFKILEKEATDSGGFIKLANYSSGDLPYYPFAFGLYVTFTYSNNELDVLFEVENRGNTHMPVGLGWHPYFTVGGGKVDEIEMKLPFVSQVELDDINLPTGKVLDFFDYENFKKVENQEFDDCFKLIMQDKGAIFSPKDGYGLSLEPSKEFLFLQVYTPGDRGSIAIEPMNCNVNAFNNQEGLMDLEKGSTYSASFKVRTMDQEEYEDIKSSFDEDD